MKPAGNGLPGFRSYVSQPPLFCSRRLPYSIFVGTFIPTPRNIRKLHGPSTNPGWCKEESCHDDVHVNDGEMVAYCQWWLHVRMACIRDIYARVGPWVGQRILEERALIKAHPRRGHIGPEAGPEEWGQEKPE